MVSAFSETSESVRPAYPDSSNPRGLTSLPKSCFVPFIVRRLRDPENIWLNRRNPPFAPLSDYSFAAPILDVEDEYSYLPEASIALAERYGGLGVGNNGGGARAGLVAGLQIKGIGCTPLAGSGNDYFHKYGGASVVEAALEAIWGEVCDAALPFGAIRVRAIIGTGTMVPRKYPRSGQRPIVARALVLRDLSVRMAHFMRAPFFRDLQGYEMGARSDTARTRDAMSTMVRFLPVDIKKNGNPVEDAVSGIRRFISRQAEQIGSARSKRIMHGSLTASNTTMTGSWIDFAGGISTISDYGRIILPRGSPDFLKEENSLQDSFRDFCFYASKYHPFGKEILTLQEAILGEFKEQLNVATNTGLLNLFGGHPTAVSRVCEGLRERVLTCISRIIRTTGTTPFTILSTDNDAKQDMPTRMGSAHLNSAILASCLNAYSKNFLGFKKSMEFAIADETLREHCAAVFGEYAKELKSLSLGLKTDGQMIYDAARLNLPCHALYRTFLYPKLEACADECVDISSWKPLEKMIEDHIGFGRMHLEKSKEITDYRYVLGRKAWGAILQSARSAPPGAISDAVAE